MEKRGSRWKQDRRYGECLLLRSPHSSLQCLEPCQHAIKPDKGRMLLCKWLLCKWSLELSGWLAKGKLLSPSRFSLPLKHMDGRFYLLLKFRKMWSPQKFELDKYEYMTLLQKYICPTSISLISALPQHPGLAAAWGRGGSSHLPFCPLSLLWPGTEACSLWSELLNALSLLSSKIDCADQASLGKKKQK